MQLNLENKLILELIEMEKTSKNGKGDKKII